MALELGESETIVTKTLGALGVPIFEYGGRRVIQILSLEEALVWVTVPGIRTIEDVRTYLTWASRYHGETRRKAILESLRAVRPLWERARRKVRRAGYSGIAAARDDDSGT